MVKKSKCLLCPGGIYIFEIWHNPLNVSALDIGGRTLKKKKIYENRQINLRSLLALGEKSNKIVASTLENTVCLPHYTTWIPSLSHSMRSLQANNAMAVSMTFYNLGWLMPPLFCNTS